MLQSTPRESKFPLLLSQKGAVLLFTYVYFPTSEEPETTAAAPSSESESSDSAEEFDESLDILRVPVSSQRKQKRGTTSRKRNSRIRESDSDDTEESDSDKQQRRKRIRKKSSVHAWTEEEDSRLKELYRIYAGSISVFDVIAQ